MVNIDYRIITLLLLLLFIGFEINFDYLYSAIGNSRSSFVQEPKSS